MRYRWLVYGRSRWCRTQQQGRDPHWEDGRPPQRTHSSTRAACTPPEPYGWGSNPWASSRSAAVCLGLRSFRPGLFSAREQHNYKIKQCMRNKEYIKKFNSLYILYLYYLIILFRHVYIYQFKDGQKLLIKNASLWRTISVRCHSVNYIHIIWNII